MLQRRQGYRAFLIIFGVPLVFLAGWAYPYVPGHELTPCAVRHMLGIDCPGCGMTRAIAALTHGEFRRSIDLNPMGIVFALMMVYLWVKVLVSNVFLNGRSWRMIGPVGAKIISFTFIAGLFTQWVVYLVLKCVSA